MHSRPHPATTTTALLLAVGLLAGCAAQARPKVFELSGRLHIEGTEQFQQPMLIDGQGKKWILDCAASAVKALQGRQVLVTVSAEGAAATSTLGVPRVCVVSIKPRQS
jgi:hypothetical protein